ncbi:hypothetical protein V2A60_010362 [Cordyceps javanica]
MDEENISSFAGITGSSTDVARGFLEVAGGDLERAVALFFENPELVSGMSAGLSGTSGSSRAPVATAPAATTSSTRTRGGAAREDSSGVIHIPSDDDEMDYGYADSGAEETHNDDDVDGHQAAQLAANYAQEDEDAAMARRLQEELYQQGGGGADAEVRAPIARTTETLVAPESAWGPDDDAALLESLRRRRPAARGRGAGASGPFAQRIWGDGTSPAGSAAANGTHARRLEDLFRPPFDLMVRMSWDEARTLGKGDKKWILVNLQDMSDFNCQALNRDIWKDESVKELVSENFIFLQYDKDYPDAEEYLTFYFPNRTHENPDNYPHVSIIDPRTGEQVKVWTGRPFPKANEFHAELAEFLDRYSLAANSKNPVAKPSGPKPAVVDVDRMTEEEMLEMALKNSLSGAGAGGSGGSGSNSSSTPNVHDPDAYTKKDTAKVAEETEDVASGDAASAAFAQISSTTPHSEPANDPATTTRIQFKHANGRVIRRFSMSDPVRTLFEWLKAEPFEGKEGVVFELKKMPQGQDLIENLDATIEDAGLKQGTVMIEFIED